MAPGYTIIVPVYNQWDRIPRLLHALKSQSSGQGQFELLLVDNGSEHFSPPDALPSWARLLTCDTPGSYAARNTGIAEARGDWLIFTDADCEPADDWFGHIVRTTSSPSAASSLFAGAIQVVATCDGEPNYYQIYDMVKGIPQAWYVQRGYGTTANLCVHRSLFTTIGVFDASRFSGGDAELCRRALAHGYKLQYLPEAMIRHPARDSWQALVTKARRVKGGQLSHGSLRRRALAIARSFSPPVIAVWRFLGQYEQPPRFRLIAVLIQLRIWLVDMHETLRLSLGTEPERR